jgi:hypothetical protein
MVVIFFPEAAETGNEHDLTGAPSMSTVHEPHCATPQPYLVPVKPISSRKTQSKGISGSTSTEFLRPLICKLIMFKTLDYGESKKC